MNYLEYKALIQELEKRYREKHKEINEKLSRQLDPLIFQYDQDIELLVEQSIQTGITGEEREKILRLQKERCDQLFDASSLFVQEHDKTLKLLNLKFQTTKNLIQERYSEENKYHE